MKDGTTYKLPLVLLALLWKYSDAAHHISMPELQAMLEEEGIQADRRTVSHALKAIGETICPVHFTRAKKQGYYIDHLFTQSEVLFLSSLVQQAAGVSASVSEDIAERVGLLVSEPQKDAVKVPLVNVTKTDNENVLKNCELILEAVSGRHAVQFHYYDLTVTKQKNYRRDRHRYTQIPYAVILHQGRCYAVCYSEHHGNFASYRVDRMDHITVSDAVYDPVPFDLEAYCRASFDMYRGDLRTITVRFDLSLSDYVRDAFGDDLVIRAIDDKSFTASAAAAMTPTLISWLLQYYDRCTVLEPAELIKQLTHIADTIRHTYTKEDNHYE